MRVLRALPVALALTMWATFTACGSDDAETVLTNTPQEPPAATPCMSPDACVASDDEGNLTQEEMALAKDAAENDSTLQSLLGDAEYEVDVGSQAWEFTPEITFVTVNFALSDPLSVNADLPRLDTGARGGEADPTTIILPSPGYAIETEHYRLDAMAISALVYVETGRVVQIFPIPFSLEGPGTGSP